ncbi:receptor-like serine/threonine-protein kinase [Tanacetum coccineum]
MMRCMSIIERRRGVGARAGAEDVFLNGRRCSVDWWLNGFSGELWQARHNSHDSVSGDIPKSGGISSTPTMRGAVCYVVREYSCGGDLSEKCDVYSFWVLLLVVIAGRRPLQVGGSPMSEFQRANLLLLARHLTRAGKLIDLPSMKEIVAMLSGDLELPPLRVEYSPSPPSRFRSHRKAQRPKVMAHGGVLAATYDYHHFPHNVLAMIVDFRTKEKELKAKEAGMKRREQTLHGVVSPPPLQDVVPSPVGSAPPMNLFPHHMYDTSSSSPSSVSLNDPALDIAASFIRPLCLGFDLELHSSAVSCLSVQLPLRSNGGSVGCDSSIPQSELGESPVVCSYYVKDRLWENYREAARLSFKNRFSNWVTQLADDELVLLEIDVISGKTIVRSFEISFSSHADAKRTPCRFPINTTWELQQELTDGSNERSSCCCTMGICMINSASFHLRAIFAEDRMSETTMLVKCCLLTFLALMLVESPPKGRAKPRCKGDEREELRGADLLDGKGASYIGRGGGGLRFEGGYKHLAKDVEDTNSMYMVCEVGGGVGWRAYVV